MFGAIESRLAEAGLARYELSNFARPGRESRHNLLYWTDQPYWGLGVGAHSFLPYGRYGTRFWNPGGIQDYARQIAVPESFGLGLPSSRQSFQFLRDLPEPQVERLATYQALTDFCHTSLRLSRGLSEDALRLKFANDIAGLAIDRLERGREAGYFARDAKNWFLTDAGKLLANPAFELVAFLADEVPLG
jgi:oxygen-independent coproporphyrinogen-3 oxidase